MAGNSQRRGAMRNPGSKKGPTVGSGGQRRKALAAKGPTPKAEDRPHHPAARAKRSAAKRASAGAKESSTAGAGRSRPESSSQGSILAGRNPVVEALQARVPAKALYVQTRLPADDRLREAVRIAAAESIPILEVSKSDLDRMTEGAVHQGMALTLPAYAYADLEQVMNGSLLVLLDGVTDPRNLGAVARSAAAFGADGLVIPVRRSAGVTAGAWKASAGALARVPVAQVTNLTRAIGTLQDAGYAVVGLTADGEVDLDDLPGSVVTDRLALVVGSEGAGLGRLVSQSCDWRARIAMHDGNESLNASVAAGIGLYAIARARA
jgi:23S rRNA (guanosine2251-2'-O)-methyltransferase